MPKASPDASCGCPESHSRSSRHHERRRQQQPVTRIGDLGHSTAASVEPVWRHQRLDGPRWLGWRKIMNVLDPNTLDLGRATQGRELQDDELDAVSGGLVVIAIIAIQIALLLPAVQAVRLHA
jgi:hypothetical protein